MKEKKIMHALIKPLNQTLVRLLLLTLLIGLATTGCGSSSDSPQPQTPGTEDSFQNSAFYGAYQVNVTIGDCPAQLSSTIIGNDEDQIGETNYIYIADTGTEYSGVGFSISRSNNVITLTKDETGYHQNVRIAFSEDLTTGTLSGTVQDDDGCTGDVTGDITLITHTPAQISSSYLQYRTYPESNLNHQSAWIELTKDGQPIVQEDISEARLYRALEINDNLVGSAKSPDYFSTDSTYYGSYNSETETVDVGESLQTISGMSLKLNEGLPQDDYIFVADLTENEMTYSVRKRIHYSGDTLSPIVSNIMTQRNETNDLVISWDSLPEGTEAQSLRVKLVKADYGTLWKDLLIVTVESDELTHTITIPAATMTTLEEMAEGIPGYGVLTVQVQTRTFNEDGMNDARGYSDVLVDNTPFYGAYGVTLNSGEVCEESFSLTIGNDIDRACLDDYIYLPDHMLSANLACGTITRIGKTLFFDGLDETESMQIDFNDNLDAADLTGTKASGECTGGYTGTASLITRDPMTVQFSYITSIYNISGFDGITACIALKQGANPIDQEDVLGVRIYNGNDVLVGEEGPNVFQSQSALFGASIEDLAVFNWAGLTVSDFSILGNLPEDTYTIYVLTADGYTVSSQVPFSGIELIPVLSGARSFTLTNSGEMALSWTLSDTDFDELFVSIYKTDDDRTYKDHALTLKVDPADNIEQMTIPQDVVNGFYETGNDIIWMMELQTRRYTNEGSVYTSGYSLRSLTIAPSAD